MAEQSLPSIEYHLEVTGPGGIYGHYKSSSPFPAFSDGDVVWLESPQEGEPVAVPEGRELVVISVEHSLDYRPQGIIRIITTVITDTRRRS